MAGTKVEENEFVTVVNLLKKEFLLENEDDLKQKTAEVVQGIISRGLSSSTACVSEQLRVHFEHNNRLIDYIIESLEQNFAGTPLVNFKEQMRSVADEEYKKLIPVANSFLVKAGLAQQNILANFEQQIDKKKEKAKQKIEIRCAILEKQKDASKDKREAAKTAPQNMFDEKPKSGTQRGKMKYDLFISHASEDKKDFVEPLANALNEAGVKVWYDRFELKLGDSLRGKIDEGLTNSRYGVVVLSNSFFNKEWPKTELDALVSRQNEDGEKVILPIWHEIGINEVSQFSPILASKLAAQSSDSLESIVDQIKNVLNKNPTHEKSDKKKQKDVPKDKEDLAETAKVVGKKIYKGEEAWKTFEEKLSKFGSLETPFYPFKAGKIKYWNLTGKSDICKYGGYRFSKEDSAIIKNTVGSTISVSTLRAYLSAECNVHNPDNYSWKDILAALEHNLKTKAIAGANGVVGDIWSIFGIPINTNKLRSKLKRLPLLLFPCFLALILLATFSAWWPIVSKKGGDSSTSTKLSVESEANKILSSGNQDDSVEISETSVLDKDRNTQLRPRIKKRIDELYDEIDNEKLKPWVFIDAGVPVRVTRHDGSAISCEGVIFQGVICPISLVQSL